ncbi:MAG: DUF5652 family protein [Paludibacter sp.]|nr:DUF5652 family protein [Paludibacter sp.]
MESIHHLVSTFAWFIPLIVFCAVWDGTWKLIGMWKAGRNNELAWFICIAIFNTMGILPIIYILLRKDQDKKKQVTD